MKVFRFGALLPLVLAALPAAQSAGAASLVLGSVESRWDQVYCDLTELKRTPTGELNVRFQYRNAKPQPHPLPHVNLIRDTRVFDAANSTLYGVLMDAAGKEMSSTVLAGAAARPIPAGTSQAHWARLQAPPAHVAAVTVLIEGCLPFDDVTIGAGPSVAARAAPAPAVASQEGEHPGLVVEVIGLSRHGPFATLSFRYRNTGPDVFSFPHRRTVRDSYFLDNANRRKYDVVRNQEQQPLCSENVAFGSGSGDRIPPGGAISLWAKFASPPPGTEVVSVFLPFAPPFDDVSISGAGATAEPAGSAVAASVLGVDAALEDLGAKVTETEIRIDLAADVLFDFDRSDIKPEAEPSLGNVATVLKAHPGAAVSIEGHTDAKGGDAYNQSLSERRAASVKQWLVSKGQANGATITTRGWGETKPIAHNTKPDGSDDPDGRAKNRRVEIVVTKGA